MEQRRQRAREVCAKCGATRIDNQIGLEETPEAYVARMVEVFREVKRVLAAHGTCWVNMGDSYAASLTSDRHFTQPTGPDGTPATKHPPQFGGQRTAVGGLKPKDLCGIPWRLAFALQADGWYLRSDIIWSKPNPMPESVTDRPTKAHEMIFLLSKAPWTGPEPGQFGDISNEDARWLALLFDTEGNIVVKRAERDDRLQYGAQIAFANTNRPLLEQAQAIVGAGSINERGGKNAPMFYWQLSGRQARDLLYRIYPFLIVKQRQARVAIHMQDVIAEPKKRPGGYRSSEHATFLERCWLTVKDLNHFGTPDLSWVPEPRYGKWGATRYFFDQEAVREPHKEPWRGNGEPERNNWSVGGTEDSRGSKETVRQYNPAGRNIRSVWEIATQPFPEAHFATFPEELVRRCLLAGCPEQVCGECGKARERIVDVTYGKSPAHGKGSIQGSRGATPDDTHMTGGYANKESVHGQPRVAKIVTTEGFTDCGHNAYRPGIVLDPFMGSGTTALVARKHGRHSIGIELNEEYAAMTTRRLAQQSLLV